MLPITSKLFIKQYVVFNSQLCQGLEEIFKIQEVIEKIGVIKNINDPDIGVTIVKVISILSSKQQKKKKKEDVN